MKTSTDGLRLAHSDPATRQPGGRPLLVLLALLLAAGLPALAVDLEQKGAVWVAAADGLHKISATDDVPLLHLPSPANPTSVAVDTSNRVVWAYAAPDLHAFDFQGQPLLTVPIGQSGATTHMVVKPDDGSVWLSVDTTLVNVGSGGAVLNTVGLPEVPLALDIHYSYTLWVAYAQSVVAYDAVTGAQSGSVDDLGNRPKIRDIAINGSYLWVGLSSDARRYTLSGATATYDRGFGINGLLYIDQAAANHGWAVRSNEVILLNLFPFNWGQSSQGDPFPGKEAPVAMEAAGPDESLWVASDESRIAHLWVLSSNDAMVDINPATDINDLAVFPRDASKPSIGISSPGENGWVTTSTPTVSVTYGDGSGSGVDPSTLSVSGSGGDYDCTTSETSATCTPSSALGEGSRVVYARVHDFAGNWSDQITRMFFVDTIPPTLAISSPTEGAVIANQYEPIVLSYSDAGSGAKTQTLAVEVNGAAHAFDCVHSSGTATCTPVDPLPAGGVVVTATIEDVAGNLSPTAQVGFTISSGVDVTPPELAFIGPLPGTLVPDSSPRILLHFEDAESGVDTATLSIQVAGGELQRDCTFYAEDVRCVPQSPFAEGPVSLTATIQDVAGNVSATATLDFTIIPSVSGVVGVVQLSDGSPFAGAEVTVLGPSGSTTLSAADGSFSFAGIDVSSGEALAVVARDGLGEGALVGGSRHLMPQATGVIDAGVLVLEPICERRFGNEFGPLNELEDGWVRALAEFDDGTGPALYVGGSFQYAGGTLVNNIAKWDGTSWSALASGIGGTVYALEVYDDGTGPALYVGGSFSSAGAVSASDIIRWDGTSFSALGSGTDGWVYDLAVFDDGTGPALYMGGEFSSVSGQPVSNLARWDGFAWSDVGGGTGNDVYGLEAWDDGSGPALYVGGNFTSAGPLSTMGLARWDGASWSEVGEGINGGARGVAASRYPSDAALYVVGSFGSAGGQVANGIARWDGTAWSTLGDGLQSQVLTATVYDDGTGPTLYAGGYFDGELARWDGTSWNGVGTGFSGFFSVQIEALFDYDDQGVGYPGGLFIGGRFEFAGGRPSVGLAKWSSDCTPIDLTAPEITFTQPTPGSATNATQVTFQGSLSESATLTLDGAPVTVQPDLTFDHGPVTLADGLNLFEFVATDESGNVTQAFFQLIRDTTAPTLGFLAPPSGATVPTGQPRLELAHGDDVGVDPETLEISVGGAPLAVTCRSFVDRSHCTPDAPFADGSVSLTATLADRAGNLSPAAQVNFTVDTSGGSTTTTVTGTVQMPWGDPVAGAEVAVLGQSGATALTLADGSFTIGGVDTLAAATLTVTARRTISGDGLLGIAVDLVPVPGGVTDAGTIVLRPVCAQGFDPTFNSAIGVDALYPKKTPSFYDTYYLPRIRAMAVFDDGSGPALYVGGNFLVAGGVPARNIARWDGSSWSALGSQVHGGGVSSTVRALEVFDDGSGTPALYVGGGFNEVDGATIYRIAKWDGISWSALDTGTTGSVYALETHDDGSGPALYAGGRFSQAGGVSAMNIARWDGTAWSALGDGLGDSSDYVFSLAVWGKGKSKDLFAGGDFTFTGTSQASRIARWDGSSWHDLDIGVFPIPNSQYPYTTVSAMAPYGNGLYVGGWFSLAGTDDVPAHGGMAKWNGRAWSEVPGIEVGGVVVTSSPIGVQALKTFDDGSGNALYAHGAVRRAGTSSYVGVLRWDGSSWSDVGGGLSARTWAGLALEVWDSDPDDAEPAKLYAGGTAKTVSGLGANRIAAWDGTSWEPLGAGAFDIARRLVVVPEDGEPALYVMQYQSVTRWDGEAWRQLPFQTDFPYVPSEGSLHDAMAFDDGSGTALYVAGEFSTLGPWEANGVARWNGTSWEPLGVGPISQGISTNVWSLGVFDDGSGPALYAGGELASTGSALDDHIAKWDGSTWVPLATGIDTSWIYVLQSFDDGTGAALYAGGSFSAAGGQPVSNLARWDGTTWSDVGGGTNGPIVSAAVFDDGSGPALFVSGGFTTAGGLPANYVAKWDGSAWSALGTGTDGSVVTLVVLDDGDGPALYAGGNFKTAGGVPANKVARWDGSAWSAVGSDIDVQLVGVSHTPGINYVGEVADLAAYDDGSGLAVYVSGAFAHGPWGISAYYGYLYNGGEVVYVSRLSRAVDCSAGDTTPPSISFVAPTPGASVPTLFPQLELAYSDDDAGVWTSTLEVTQGGVPLALDCSSSPSSATCVPQSPLAEGAVTLSATVRDNAGNLSSPAGVSFSVQLTPPTVTFVTPATGQYVDDALPPIRVDFTDNGDGIDTVSFLLESLSPANSFQCQVDVSGADCAPDAAYPEGPVTLQATVRDLGGRLSDPAQSTFTVDTAPPTLAFTAPPDGYYTNNLYPEMTLAYSDSGSGVDTSTLRILRNGTWIFSTCSFGPSEAVCTPTYQYIQEGANVMTADVEDFSGKVSNVPQITINYLPDFDPPAITLTSPVEASVIATPQINFVGSLDEAGTLTLDGAPVTVEPDLSFDHGPVSLAEGWNSLLLEATDLVGNSSQLPVTVFLDSQAPVLAFLAPLDGEYFDPTVTPIELRWGDSGTGIDAASLQVLANGVPLAADCSFCSTGVTCTPNPPLTEQVVTLTASVADEVGNPSPTVQVRFTTVPGLDIVPPEIYLSAPLPGSTTSRPQLWFIGALSEPATLTLDGAPVTVDADNLFRHGPETLAEGPNSFDLVAVDAAGNVGSLALTVTLDSGAPSAVDGALVTVGASAGGFAPVTGAAGAVTVSEAGLSVVVRNTLTGAEVSQPPAGDGSFAVSVAAVGGHKVSVTVEDPAGNASAPRIFTVPGSPTQPPDPAAVAPPVDPTVASDFCATTAFLHSGANPVQTGVSVGAIDCRRVAVVRGRVLDTAGAPISAATVSAYRQSEVGSTLTRADGGFDLAVHGGDVTLRLAKAGLLPADRLVAAPVNEFTTIDDVILLAPDSQATAVDLALPDPVQVARGSAVTDADGSRQATLLLFQGTSAAMRFAGGATTPLSTLTVRATEYTVGSGGPSAMPAELPFGTDYTYAVELSADEALAAGASGVEFSQPVVTYLENFLAFPAGTVVPAGYYDRELARWVAGPNGLVIAILGVTGGLADLDVDGTGQPADAATLAALGISDAERQQLASLYTAGQSLWRVAVRHFTPWDFNYWAKFPPGAEAPDESKPKGGDQDKSDKPCETGGSVIECQNQILGEVVGVTGTPYTLNYRSDRVPGRTIANTLDFTLGDTLPPGVKGISLRVNVAGQTFAQSFPAQTGQTYTFTWDGLDAYGRPLQGRQPYAARTGYVYDVEYQDPPPGCEACFGSGGDGSVTGDPARLEGTLWQTHKDRLGAWDARTGFGLGGWSLSVHHSYDPFDRILYRGDGSRRQVDALRISSVIAASGTPHELEAEPDGTVHYVDAAARQVKRISPEGFLEIEAGADSPAAGPPASGVQARNAWLAGISDIAVSPDGLLHILSAGSAESQQDTHVWRLEGDGSLTEVLAHPNAGGWPLATSEFVNVPGKMTFDRFGDLYISDEVIFPPLDPDDQFNKSIVIWRVDIGAGRVEPYLMGTLWVMMSGDLVFKDKGSPPEGYSTALALTSVGGMAFDDDGDLYFTVNGQGSSIWRRGPTGEVTRVAGSCVDSEPFTCSGFRGDGGPATDAHLFYPEGLDVLDDGTIVFADQGNHRIRSVSPYGTITTIAGTGQTEPSDTNGQATQTNLAYPTDVARLPDGDLAVSNTNHGEVRRVGAPSPVVSLSELRVPEEDGSVVHVFDPTGRHLKTEDARTGDPLVTFGYDSEGYLTTITDAFDNVTTVVRDGSGNPTAMQAPFGQQTDLTLDPNGYLESITNPAGESVELGHNANGLLESMTDPKQRTYNYTYDPLGRLEKDEDPLLGFTALGRTEIAPGGDVESGFVVTRSTALGRATTYTTERLITGERRISVSDPAGLTSTTVIGPDGSRTDTAPDGTVATMAEGPDPRFGMLHPLAQTVSVTTPGGLVSSTTTSRAVALATPGADPTDPASIASVTDSVTVNGRTATTVHDYAANTVTTTTPEGRASATTLDLFGRVAQSQLPGLAAVQYAYDARGRLETVTQGSRTVTYAYDPDGYLEKVTDPLTREESFSYDLAGRVKTRTLPDLRQVRFDYDANGNLTAITPPGRPAHAFDHTLVDLPKEYDPPDVGLPIDKTTLDYNLDQQVELVTRPDGQTIDYVYGPTTGRLDSAITPRGNYAYAYDPSTGNLSSVTDPDLGSITYGYDGTLPTSVTWAGDVAGTIGLAYDDDFELTQRTVNGAHAVDFDYDDDGLLTQAGALTLSRDPASGFLAGTSVGGLTDSYTYDPTYGELSAYTAAHGATALFAETITLRDDLGRIKEKSETVLGGTDTYVYTYDTAGRLTDVEKNSVAIAHYDYDANSNRDGWTDSQGSGTATYDDQDRLLTYGGLSFTYTANGELLTRSDGSSTVTYDYDVVGNLRQVQLASGITIDYVIDASNRRVGKKVNGVLSTGWLYKDRLNPVAQLDGAGNVVFVFVYGSKANVPDYIDEPATGKRYRIVSDHLGSVRLVVDVADGTVVQQLKYDSFGRVTFDSSAGFQPFGFAGGLYDHQTDLVRFGARDYDPETGRWTSRDPIGFAGGDPNLYGYVLQDPVNLVDPSGEIVPLLLGAWALVEVGLTIYDGIQTVRTLLDDCESDAMKTLAVGGLLAGAWLPGGMYGTAARKGGVKAFQVGRFDELKNLGKVGDDLAIHHAGQKHAMQQVVKGYDWRTAPSIAVPTAQHRAIPNLRGVYDGNARNLLARDIRNLRNFTDAPNSSLTELIQLNKTMYPEAFTK